MLLFRPPCYGLRATVRAQSSVLLFSAPLLSYCSVHRATVQTSVLLLGLRASVRPPCYCSVLRLLSYCSILRATVQSSVLLFSAPATVLLFSPPCYCSVQYCSVLRGAVQSSVLLLRLRATVQSFVLLSYCSVLRAAVKPPCCWSVLWATVQALLVRPTCYCSDLRATVQASAKFNVMWFLYIHILLLLIHITNVHYFARILLAIMIIIYATLMNMLPTLFFSRKVKMSENVCCKAQSVCVDHRITRCKMCLLLLLILFRSCQKLSASSHVANSRDREMECT